MKHCPTCRWGPSCQLVKWVQILCKESNYWRWEEKIEKELLLSTFNYTCVGCGKRFWWGPLAGAWCYPCRNVSTESITIIGNITGGSNTHYGIFIPSTFCPVIVSESLRSKT